MAPTACWHTGALFWDPLVNHTTSMTRADTINVIQNCTRQCESGSGSPHLCKEICTAAMSVLNKSFNYSPALAATHSRIEPGAPELELELEPECENYNDPSV